MLRDDFNDVIARRHMARSTQKSYWSWIVQFLRFSRNGNEWVHPNKMGNQ